MQSVSNYTYVKKIVIIWLFNTVAVSLLILLFLFLLTIIRRVKSVINNVIFKKKCLKTVLMKIQFELLPIVHIQRHRVYP